jgi:prepilin-type N-terminal cleavage/methylation domain-containing protein
MARRAFTLVEIMVACAVLSITLTLVYNVVLLGHRAYLTGERRAELAQNGRVVLDRVVRELRQSPELLTALPDTSDDPLFPPPSELFFRNGHQLAPITYIRYWYNPADHTVNRQTIYYSFNGAPATYVLFSAVDGSGNHPTEHITADQIIGEYIQSFKPWGDRLLTIDLQLQRVDTALSLRTQVFGRNL